MPDFDPFEYKEAMERRCDKLPESEGGCWIFRPAVLTKGWENKYAVVKFQGKTTTAMRAMYLVYNFADESSLRPGQEIRHKQDRDRACHRRCINPEHLTVVQLMAPRGRRYKNSVPKADDQPRNSTGQYAQMTTAEERALREQQRKDHGHKVKTDISPELEEMLRNHGVANIKK